MIKPARWILPAALFLGLMQGTAFAADPDPSTNKVLADFIKSGVKAYFMGTQLGFNGWFLTKDNQIQIAYSTPDNQSLVVGVLYNTQGENVTTQQIKTLYDNNREVNAFLTNLNATQLPNGTATSGIVPMQAATAPALGATPALAPASPGERLVKALQDASGVNVGAQTAPKLYMVADPNCPHCQATWKALRTSIYGGKLQVRIVPIDAVDPDSARAAAQFLRAPNPIDAWDKYVGGDHKQLDGVADQASLDAIHSNHMLIDAWHITVTPYMAYRAKDGQVKIIQGEPEKAAAILDDIAP